MLATISATAPWLGIVLTVRLMIGSFTGCGCEKSTILAMVAGSFSEAFYPTAFGIATAVFAWCAREHFRSAITVLDAEMHAATLELLNCLAKDRLHRIVIP